MFTDSHCHLSFPDFTERMDEVRAAMAAAQVDRALCICTTLEEFDAVQGLAARYDNFWASVGVHPDNEDIEEPTVERLVQLSARPKVVAIGETGLDYYQMDERKGGRSIVDMEWQRDRFRTHIRAAQQVRKPLVIHTRDASADTISILKEEGETGAGKAAGGVFHCFTETAEVARAALDLGFYISFSGILTFKKAEDLRQVAAFVPLDRMLIETDSPYLAPVPFRGKTNSPALVPYVARQIADIRNLPVEQIAEVTSNNFEMLFHDLKAA
ncbi:TatD family hydrolase [Variovorax sp. OV329]|uniref:TatD family hydrolase n=1 Tax=Variovorax sp. OV329 TaxID=1882825 RepID=UPI0008E9E6D8|nr:TatD family hydrolase [Variovorax sp. OV329]SFM62065.1 TatD DNase family protein [Variovorax sp. OV329]